MRYTVRSSFREEIVTGSYLTNLRTTEVDRELILVVPVGSTEQHGPHLPLGTDTIIAMRLADELVRRLGGPAFALVAPAVAIGASGEHGGFAGTLSIGTDVLADVLVEIARSATAPNGGPFRGLLFVNAHGGNTEALRRAGSTILSEGRCAYHWSPRDPGGDAHAGRSETSVMLHLAPHLVATDRLERGRIEPTAALFDELRTVGLRGVTPNGVLGDPTTASASHGSELFSSWCSDLEQVASSLFEREPRRADDRLVPPL